MFPLWTVNLVTMLNLIIRELSEMPHSLRVEQRLSLWNNCHWPIWSGVWLSALYLVFSEHGCANYAVILHYEKGISDCLGKRFCHLLNIYNLTAMHQERLSLNSCNIRRLILGHWKRPENRRGWWPKCHSLLHANSKVFIRKLVDKSHTESGWSKA